MDFTQRLAAAAIAIACAMPAALAAPGGEEKVAITPSNLIVVLRETAGQNKQDEALQPYGRVTAQLPDGRRIELATSWYQYLGDMHIRLVFDGGQVLQSAAPNDLERLGLTPEAALTLAVANLKRVYGAPAAMPWSGGVMQVQGESADLASSYFLDRDFWASMQQGHPQGIVAAVPQRGGLVFAAADDAQAVEALRFSAAALYAGAAGSRLSSALYLFKDGHWSIFQPPRPQ